jgi:site-specific DNA recombinase
MAEMTLAREGYAKIEDKLSEEGFLARSGKTFSKSSIYEILRNPKSYGIFFYNAGNENLNSKRAIVSGAVGQNLIWIEKALPEVIPFEYYRPIQEIMDNRKRVSPRR